jgi:hypothetical protein
MPHKAFVMLLGKCIVQVSEHQPPNLTAAKRPWENSKRQGKLLLKGQALFLHIGHICQCPFPL